MAAMQDIPNADSLQLLISAATDGNMTVLQNELNKLLQSRQATSSSPPQDSSSQRQATLSFEAALHAAARNKHPQAVKYLIEKGVAIDPATVVAATAGHSQAVFDVLLGHGWDINLCLGHIGDALILAVGADKTTLVKFLLARGADPNQNLRGESHTALECAAYSASIPTIILLLDAGAQIKTRSALVIAAREGRTDVVAYLLDRGADVDEVPDNDDIYDNARQLGLGNALCTAARTGKAEVVKLLLERGANKQVRDTLGRTALDLAELNHHSGCKELLSQGE